MWADDAAARERLERCLAALARADAVALSSVEKLIGGSVQENWRLDAFVAGGPLAGPQCWVLRTDGLTGLGLGLGRSEEFAVLRAAQAAGVTVPEPIFACPDRSVIGAPFFVTRWRPGTARGGDIVPLAGTNAGDELAERLGSELALLHRLRPTGAAPSCLGPTPGDPAALRLQQYERLLDQSSSPCPVAEWGLRWLKRHRPAPAAVALCHGDFRTGNYLVDGGALTAILDWEFAAWSDPDEDIGWFCSRCWRFGADRHEAGGIGTRARFLRGYEAVAGRRVDAARMRYWEVMAALRWLLIALRQRDRFLVQGERSLDLALTGRRPAECEWEILRLLDEAEAA